MATSACDSGKDSASISTQHTAAQKAKYEECLRNNGVIIGKDGEKSGRDSAFRECQKLSPDNATEKEKQTALKEAKCMRDHGVNYPDPVFDYGTIDYTAPPGGYGVDKRTFDEILKKCDKEVS